MVRTKVFRFELFIASKLISMKLPCIQVRNCCFFFVHFVHSILSLEFSFAETKPIDLYEFLVESELQQYYNSIK